MPQFSRLLHGSSDVPASLSRLKNETVTHACCLAHTVPRHLADVCYVSTMQVTPGALDGLPTLAVTCEVRGGFLQLIGEQTEGQRGEVTCPGELGRRATITKHQGRHGLHSKKFIPEIGSGG